MNTRILLIASSVAMGALGVVTLFAPVELLNALKVAPTAPLPVLVQLLGALYIGAAMANWTAKDSLIGGIYARPLSLGNGLHFMVGAMALLKFQAASGFVGPLTAVMAVYVVFALAFGYLIFGRGAACKTN